MEKFDFSGWATRNNLTCSDKRVIIKDAFKNNDGQTVPLVWDHQHSSPFNILGHARLENRDEGVYAYCTFNDTESGKNAKLIVEHGDVSGLSIFANQLKQVGNNVIHGMIREVSLVLASANPGAFIDSVMSHSDGSESEDEAIIYTGEQISLYHSEEKADNSNSDDKKNDTRDEKDKTGEETKDKKENSDETIGEIFNTLTDKQKDSVYSMMGDLIVGENNEGAEEKSDDQSKNENITHKEDFNMKKNVFDQNGANEQENTLSHSEMQTIIADGKRYGSLKESFLAHSQEYGIENIDYLFPDAKTMTPTPDFISRDMGWVQKVMQGVHRTPFSRIKSVYANITEDEARAKGYMNKGKLKKEEVFSLLKRTTTPTTIYKKQKIDKDDVSDITDFDVLAWLKSEMRLMLDEEIARAILIGDGRLASSDDKVDENCIRPIWTDEATKFGDASLYTVPTIVELSSTATDDDRAKAFIRTTIKNRKNYKGSGNPILFTTEDVVTDCLLLEDGIGHKLYKTIEELATALRVKEIVTVEPMEGQTRTVDNVLRTLMGIVVNLDDYNVGADKGGAVSFFDDFDIDYNQQKYLIETRCSGALRKPFSAMVIESVVKEQAAG